jgi:hypothetical protein
MQLLEGVSQEIQTPCAGRTYLLTNTKVSPQVTPRVPVSCTQICRAWNTQRSDFSTSESATLIGWIIIPSSSRNRLRGGTFQDFTGELIGQHGLETISNGINVVLKYESDQSPQ